MVANAPLVVVVLIAKVHLARSQRVVKAVIHAGFVQLQKIAAKNECVREFLNQIFLMT
jgi:hypothetical protein